MEQLVTNIVIAVNADQIKLIDPLRKSINQYIPNYKLHIITTYPIQVPYDAELKVLTPKDIGYKVSRITRITYSTFFRLYIDKLFPSINKCIYLDFDTLLLEDISNLLEGDDWLIKGVKDCGPDSINAGVLCFNFTDETKSLMELCRADSTERNDQQIINHYFKDKITYINNRYNVMILQGMTEIEDPAILHFIGYYKPWMLTKYHKMYLDYIYNSI